MNPKQGSRRNFLFKTIPGIMLTVIAMPKFVKGINKDISAKRLYNLDMQEDLEKIIKLIGNKKKPLKWLFTGDSITQGASHTLGYRAYPEIFAERIRFEMNRSRDFVINTAISGNTSQDILNDFDWRIKQFCPDIVSLMIGTNDAAIIRNTSPDAFNKTLGSLIDHFRKLGAIPVLHTPNTIDTKRESGKQRKDIVKYISVIQKTARDKKVILVDHWQYWQSHNKEVISEKWRNDALHPNGKGHLEIARLLFSTLSICNDKSFTCTGKVNFNS
ncbi:MAG TPA: SGNH/GDSL hydrolase family protein [Sphingobacteriaceae bacterium]